MNRSTTVLAALSLIAAIGLSACGGGSEDPDEPAVVVQAPPPAATPVDCNTNPVACR